MASKRPVKPSSKEYLDKLTLYERLVATNPRVRRKGATMPYTSLNGHMFSVFTKSGTLALRLPVGDREAFIERFDTQLTKQYGTVMPEYVDVPDSLLADTKTLTKYFEASYRYVSSLRPKPTAKAAKTTRRKR